ncbi:MAG TPA: Clp protease N-terminal domain-containing protein, partial [Hyphomicrobiaceae bacterium]|nr:Clp protease N-terminal domain-containing protein [Hyphomicrobiaceae bacterium]
MPQVFADEFKSFPISAQLGESLERAYRFAREQSHRLVTLEHLLLALTEDAEAASMLEQASVDLGRLSADVSGYLGGLLEDMRAQSATELRPDADLMRVLKAATTAAQQSRRRQIDGAIVLAAIVGDGKSAAAGLLKALGMTFESAIRALQRANTQLRGKPAPQGAQGAGPAWGPGAGKSAMPASAEQRPAPEIAAPATAEVSLATSAEEFLAAARARIQQRAAAARAGEKPAVA